MGSTGAAALRPEAGVAAGAADASDGPAEAAAASRTRSAAVALDPAPGAAASLTVARTLARGSPARTSTTTDRLCAAPAASVPAEQRTESPPGAWAASQDQPAPATEWKARAGGSASRTTGVAAPP